MKADEEVSDGVVVFLEDDVVEDVAKQRKKDRKAGSESDLRRGIRYELEQSGIGFRPTVQEHSPTFFTPLYLPFVVQDSVGRGKLKRAHAGMQHVEKRLRIERWRERKEKTARYERHQAATLGQNDAVLLVNSAVAYVRELKKQKAAELLGALQLEGERRWLNVAQPEWISTWDEWRWFLWALEVLPEEVEWSYWTAQIAGSDPDPRLELLANFAERWASEVVADRGVYYDRAVERRYDGRVVFVLRYRHFDYDFWAPRESIPAHYHPAVCLVCGGGFFPFRNKDLCHECASDDAWMCEMFEIRATRLGVPLDQFIAKKSGGTSAFDSRRLDALAEVVAQTRRLGATVRQVAAVLKCSTGRVSKLEARAKVNAHARGWEETR